MDNQIIGMIISIIIMATVIVMTSYVVPALKQRIGAERLEELEEYVCLAVRCAEQLYTPEQWEEKKRFVHDYIVKRAADIGMTETDVNILIEAIVHEIKHEV